VLGGISSRRAARVTFPPVAASTEWIIGETIPPEDYQREKRLVKARFATNNCYRVRIGETSAPFGGFFRYRSSVILLNGNFSG